MRLRVWVAVIAFMLLGSTSAMASFRGRDGSLAVQPESGPGVVLVNLEGHVEARICGPGTACAGSGPVMPRWAPDGRSLVLSSVGRESGAQIVYPDSSCLDCLPIAGVGAFTSNPAVITVVTDGSLLEYGIDGIQKARLFKQGVSDAAWSSGGELAVVRGSSVWAGRPGRLRQVGHGQDPSWSPDGSEVALVRDGWVTIATLRDGKVRRLVRGNSPTWSPNGRSIAFLTAGHRLFVVPASGGVPRVVGDIRGRSLDWQPLPSHVRGCVAPPGSSVIARSGDGIVTEDGFTAPFQISPTAAVMGCLVATGRERLLVGPTFASVDEEMGVTGAATAGDYAALETFQTDIHYGGSSNSVVVYDLQTGAPMESRGGETVGCDGYSCTSGMDNLVINSQGFTAVHTDVSQSCQGNMPASAFCETIQASDSAGPQTLDTAPSSGSGALTDLALNGDTLTWLHDATPESAELH